MEVQTQKTNLWTQRGKERVGQMERVAWKNVHYICKMDSQWEFAV